MNIGLYSKLAVQSFLTKPISRLFVIFSASFVIFIIALLVIVWTSFSKALIEIKESYSLVAFLDNNSKPDKDKELVNQIEKISGVKSAQSISREAFMSQFSKFFPQLSKDISSLDSELIPRYIKIQANADSVDEIKRQVENLKSIQSVETNPERFKNLISAITTLQRYVAMLLLAAIAAIASIFMNHFKSDQIHRFQIISTMKLLGGRVSQMITPFVFEGILEGLICGLIAVLFLLITGQVFEDQLSKLFLTLGYPYTTFPFSISAIYSLTFSVMIGLFASLWAIGFSVLKK